MERTCELAKANLKKGFVYWFTGEALPDTVPKNTERGYLLSDPERSLWVHETLHPSKWGSCPRRWVEETSS